ncbi:MAG: hypothetical protein CTY19_12220 [Methylomonas sp.]|nr:MAG: hypothetical protein CTY19_12220 [Methylomonas sp.]
MPITLKHLTLAVSCLAGSLMLQPAAAATPAEQDILRLHTGLPKKSMDSLFSYTVEWRQDEQQAYHVTGLSFLNAEKYFDEDGRDRVTKKIITSLKDGMIQLDPKLRGINLTQTNDLPQLKIANKAGYSLTYVMFRDYTNQALSFDLQDKSFSADGVKLAIDLVYAADVEYLEKFTAHKSQTASQGTIEIQIDQQTPVHIKTDGKTTAELEKELAQAVVQASLSSSALVPHIVNKDTRNNKPFDGSEVQLLNLAAKRISIEVTDPSLGVLMKFKFQDENATVKVAEPRFMMGVFAVAIALVLGYFGFRSRKKPL